MAGATGGGLDLALAGLAHDLGHALGALGSRARRARAARSSAELLDELDALEAALEQARGLHRGIGALARGAPLRCARLCATTQLEAAAAALRARAAPHQRVQVIAPPPGAPRPAVWAEAGAVLRVLVNLGQNAFEAGAARVELSLGPGTHPGRLRLRVRDDGPGLPPARARRPFAPAPDGSGRGLGLACASELAARLEGSLSLLETGPGGTTFALQLERLP